MKNTIKRLISAVIMLTMLLSLLPAVSVSSLAAEEEDIDAALSAAETYVTSLIPDAATIASITSSFGTQFDWDNEKRESANKSYLFEWSYYNGVVFEGLNDLYAVTEEQAYYDDVAAYLGAMISGNTDQWKKCTNNSAKDAAGYVNTHGVDCYKTASLLLDYGYTAMAQKLYNDLQTAENTYSSSTIGGNFNHTWSSQPTYKVWLDGLYMVQPFMAQYAAYSNDTAELSRIAGRFAWIGTNMYNSSTGLFYHAANSSSDHSAGYWLRAIGWYAAAMADVIPFLSGSDQTALIAQLKQLIDGMLTYQDSVTGMWKNYVNYTDSSSGAYRYETSGTALVAYAILKAVNNGWIADSYAEYGINAFIGICENKLTGNNTTLTDICTKGSPGSDGTNTAFSDNEGKGVGPFIMAYAEMMKLTAEDVGGDPEPSASPDIPNDPDTVEETVNLTNVTVSVSAVCTAASVTEVDDIDTVAAAEACFDELIAVFDVSLTGYTESNPVTVSISIPDGTNVGDLAAFYLPESGDPVVMDSQIVDGAFVFVTNHNSVYAYGTLADAGEDVETKEAEEVETVPAFVLTSTLGTSGTYIISSANSGTSARLLNRNNSSVNRSGSKTITTQNGKSYILAENVDDTSKWTFSNSHFSNSDYYLNGTYSSRTYSLTLGTSDNTASAWSYDSSNKRLSTSANSNTVYLRYSSSSFSISTTKNSIYIFELQDIPLSSHEYRVSAENINVILETSSTTATISKTLYRDDTAYTPTGGSWSYIVYQDDDIINDISNAGVISFTGTAGTAKVRVRYTTAAGTTVWDTITVTVRLPIVLTVSPATQTLNTGTVTLSSTVTGATVPAGAAIVWTSSNPYAATVNSAGVVTAVNYGSAVISAALTASNGEILATGRSEITVNRPYTSYSFIGGPVYSALDGTPDFRSIELHIVYTDGAEAVIPYEALTFDTAGCDTSVAGTTDADVSYGALIGSIPVIVTGTNDHSDVEPAESIPEYPNPGAVVVDKTATYDETNFSETGVTQVELSVAGVSESNIVDVIMVLDISNSMAWSTQNSSQSSEPNRKPSSGQQTKLRDAMDSASDFAEIFLDGNNTISLVTFAGYDTDWGYSGDSGTYLDSVRTLMTAESDLTACQTMFDGLDVRNTSNSSTATYSLFVNNVQQSLNNRGDTNYDYGFAQAAATIPEIYTELGYANEAAYLAAGRRLAVIFLTDGAPSQYEGVRNSGRSDKLPNSSTVYTASPYYSSSYSAANEAGWLKYLEQTQNSYALEVYNKATAGFYAIGFDLDNGGFRSNSWSTDELTTVLQNMVKTTVSADPVISGTTVTNRSGPDITVATADDAETLSGIYAALAAELRIAASEAEVFDVVDSNFTLQIGDTVGITPDNITVSMGTSGRVGQDNKIVVSVYDIYTPNEVGTTVGGVTVTNDMIGTRQSAGTALETVTFNAAGTAACSDQLGSTTNILSMTYYDVQQTHPKTLTIEAEYFTYQKTYIWNSDYSECETGECFNWHIGEISNQEVSLSFFAYLKGALEGQAPEGLYYTNEYATLDYLDMNDKHAHQDFPVPSLIWGTASATVRFYYVDENGYPVNSSGERINSIAMRIIAASKTVTLNLNEQGVFDGAIIGEELIPEGYSLYDPNAGYSLVTSSLVNGEYVGGQIILVNSPRADDATYNTTLEVSHAIGYQSSVVDIAIMRPDKVDFTLTPQKFVIDYGKPVTAEFTVSTVGSLENMTAEFAGAMAYSGSTWDSKNKLSAAAISAVDDDGEATGRYGNFTVSSTPTSNTDESVLSVNYVPTALVNGIDRVLAVYKFTDVNNAEHYYYLGRLVEVYPATNVYYETDFASGVFIPNTEDGVSFTTVGTSGTGEQDFALIGASGVTYGYDSSYETDGTYSNGSSLFVNNTSGSTYKPAISFTFTGTGFDVFSRTGVDQGAIRVLVMNAEGTKVRDVSVLNKSDGGLELYQIPVVSIEGLAHGTYSVEINVLSSYENSLHPSLARGGEFYFDAVRIYAPMGNNPAAVEVYTADHENDPELFEIRNLLIAADSFDVTEETDGIVFIDWDYSDENYHTDVIDDYTSWGPNNEVYLQNAQAVAFEFTSGGNSGVDIGLKTISASTQANAVITRIRTGSADTVLANAAVSSATEQYYALGGSDTIRDGDIILITNTGSGVLSITGMKVVDPQAPPVMMMSSSSVKQAYRVLNNYFIPSVTTETVDPENMLTVSGTVSQFRSGKSTEAKPVAPATPESTEAEPEIAETPVEAAEAPVTVYAENRSYAAAPVEIEPETEAEPETLPEPTAEAEPEPAAADAQPKTNKLAEIKTVLQKQIEKLALLIARLLFN